MITYTFKRNGKSMMLQGYDIDSAMAIADLMIKQTVDGFWKCDVEDPTTYQWKEFERVQYNDIPC